MSDYYNRRLGEWVTPGHEQKFIYIDTVRTKKGKLRTWLGHLRALAKVHGLSVEELKKRAGH